MKALSFQIPKSGLASVRIQIDDLPYLYDRLHYHPEVQITYIERSKGTLFVGDGIHRFQDGDLIVLGSNVPHLFKNDPVYYEQESPGAYAISAFFDLNAFGKDFFDLPELLPTRKLLKQASRGIKVNGKIKEKVAHKMATLPKQEGLRTLIQLLDIIELITTTDQLQFLSRPVNDSLMEEADGQRLNAVFQLIIHEYRRTIPLEEAARTANLSVSAFCRYFKLRTRKTFIQFLNEFRINTACRLLNEQEFSISQICYEVGFNNLSNFNRQFKQVTGRAPSEYLLEREVLK